jgi:hypothetical protein
MSIDTSAFGLDLAGRGMELPGWMGYDGRGDFFLPQLGKIRAFSFFYIYFLSQDWDKFQARY